MRRGVARETHHQTGRVHLKGAHMQTINTQLSCLTDTTITVLIATQLPFSKLCSLMEIHNCFPFWQIDCQIVWICAILFVFSEERPRNFHGNATILRFGELVAKFVCICTVSFVFIRSNYNTLMVRFRDILTCLTDTTNTFFLMQLNFCFRNRGYSCSFSISRRNKIMFKQKEKKFLSFYVTRH